MSAVRALSHGSRAQAGGVTTLRREGFLAGRSPFTLCPCSVCCHVDVSAGLARLRGAVLLGGPVAPVLAGEGTCREPRVDSVLTLAVPGSPLIEKGLSLLGYQLCNYSVTQNVQKVEAVQLSQATYAPCGGWIPWRRCPKTVYRTRYLAVDVPASRNVTDCCEGYEQLGLYCVLRECGVPGGGGRAHLFLTGRGGGDLMSLPTVTVVGAFHPGLAGSSCNTGARP